MEALLIAIFGAFLWLSVILHSASRVIPIKELRRRARNKEDSSAAKIYKMAAFGESLRLFLWLVGSLSTAGLIWVASQIGWYAIVIMSLAIGWLIWKEYETDRMSNWQWRTASLFAPLIGKMVSALQPVLGRIGRWLSNRRIFKRHTRVYEKEDLIELLEIQGAQHGNRISDQELKIAKGALTFGDKTVGGVMTPKRMVKMVAAGDSIGPVLMDELHESGFSRFPVVKDGKNLANPEIIGILYLGDIVGHEGKGKIKDVMKKRVNFINETQSLRAALNAFISTEQHLLIVVNNFEELVGVLGIEDVLEEIVGEKLADEYDRYDDLRTVAGLEAQKEHIEHAQQKSELEAEPEEPEATQKTDQK